MRAQRRAHHEGEFHLVKRSLEIRERNGAKDCAAFVTGDFRFVTPDICEQAAATVGCSEIRVREEWAGHSVKDSMLLPLLFLQDPERSVGVI
jgi:hypothetical protein